VKKHKEHKEMTQSSPLLGSRTPSAAVLVVAATLFSAQAAHAYGDPGSGALLWQLIVAGMFGFLFYIRQTVRKIREWFGPKQTPPSAPED